VDYLVDAHDGSVVYYYSVSPTALERVPAGEAPRPPQPPGRGKQGRKQPRKPAAGKGKRRLADMPRASAARAVPKALPGLCKGIDEEGQVQQFYARAVQGGFELTDPQRLIHTYDLNGGDIDGSPLPSRPIPHSTFDWGALSTAGVSAHVNATRVFDFYNNVLIRKGIDDKGMELVNVVNVTSQEDEDPPVWHNAVWWKKRMWYGRASDKPGQFRSFARYLDIIGHELTHGVTETTSNLVYRDEAGALNESFSDIFGVLINNWARKGADSDPESWDWEIGAGLGEKPGRPLRNMKNPKLTGDPDHMRDYQYLAPDDDFGGVHTNSNIHNKAAYNLLTARQTTSKRGKRGPLVFEPTEVAKLYYFTLQRLDRVATFEDVLDTLIDVAKTVYPDPAQQAPKLAAIREAYRKIGIPRE
jgi:Zn-dependent metalloprotease